MYQLRAFASRIKPKPLIISDDRDIDDMFHSHTNSIPVESPNILVREPTSTSEKGSMFEHQTVEALNRIGFDVHRCGGPYDEGIDFRGTWKTGDKQHYVVGQCKMEAKKAGTGQMREFLGVLLNGPPRVIGVFATAMGYSDIAKKTVFHYDVPIVLCIVRDKKIVQFLPNMTMQKLSPKLVVKHKPDSVALYEI